MSKSGPGGGLRNTIYRYRTMSGRTMSRTRRFAYRVLAPILAGLVRSWWRSCPVVVAVGEEHLDAVLAAQPSFLPVYWHQHNLFCTGYLLAQQARRPMRIGFLISPSLDGELAAQVVQRLGGYPIRGSSTHTGALAMKETFQALMREKVSAVLTPDGPRGPRFKFKPGAVLLAQMSGRPLVPMAFCASRALLVHWDKFVLPVPFCRIAVAIGAPRTVDRSIGAAGLLKVQEEMEQQLKAVFASARAALQRA
jgi:lysophospholipid acyltransferase (LPLAT)-like uncharacterized protein